MFNALSYTKNLEEKGFTREEAEVLVGMFMQMLEFNMVSKTDFERLRTDVNHRFEEVDKRFSSLEQKMTYELNKLSLQLTVKLGLMLATSVGLISTILAIKL